LFHRPCYLYKQEQQNITASFNIKKKDNQNHTVDYFLRRNKLLVIGLNDEQDSSNSDQNFSVSGQISAESSQSSGKNIGEEMMLEIKTPPLKQIQLVVEKKKVCTKQ
jgi:hypothetical protein